MSEVSQQSSATLVGFPNEENSGSVYKVGMI